MEALIQPALSLLGVIITAVVTWLVSRRSTRVQNEQQKEQNELGLVDRYRSEIDRIDEKLDEQSEDISRLTRENIERTTEVLNLREEMAKVRRDHLAETAKLEATLFSFRGYIASVLEWINRRFEAGELDTEADVPEPPPEYRL
ncbi:hypothetical protein [Brevibacterium sp. CFH 10365]|uniref:hypothetical protein n=1 Tax=Brevibacterium sp. CFH 10365 TaxID=2585207 RepID=UPI00126670EC|nr:hypothetical protein [Brevibacterium sp. CFH 10365]